MNNTHPKMLTLPSSFDQLEKLEPFLADIQDEFEIDNELFSRIELALNEAVVNAIVHGNKQDEAKSVHLSAAQKDHILEISVRDEGGGFDPSALPDPLEDENLLKDSGRGVFLIKQYADKVEFSENATKLTMQFTLDTES